MVSEEEKIWVPSYETRDIEESEPKPMSLGESMILGAAWTAVYLTLPISYFYVWKKRKQNEEVIVTRLGRVQKPTKGSYLQKLPFIDSEVSISLEPKTSSIKKHLLLTLDKAAVLVGVDVEWRVSDAVVAYKSATNFEECFLNALRPVLRKRIERTVIRVLATEQSSLESKLRTDFNYEGQLYGIAVDAVVLHVEASATQPYLSGRKADVELELPANPMAAALNGAPVPSMGNFGDVLRNAGSALPPNLMEDLIGGLANHPGFSNILQNLGQSQTSSDSPLEKPKTIEEIVSFFKSKNLRLKKRLDVIIDNETTIIITDTGIHESLVDACNQFIPAAEVKLSLEDLAAFIAREQSYLEAYQAGKVAFSGDASLIKDLLQQL